jgi:hypothetical protein
VFVLSMNQRGAIAELKIAAAAAELGIPVLRPMTDHCRYDLAFEVAGRLLRVQCKCGSLDPDGAVIRVNLQRSWLSPTAMCAAPIPRRRSMPLPSIAAMSTAATFSRAH